MIVNRTTSTPISVLHYDVDKDLLLRYGIQHLPFLVVQKIKVEDKSLFGYCCCTDVKDGCSYSEYVFETNTHFFHKIFQTICIYLPLVAGK